MLAASSLNNADWYLMRASGAVSLVLLSTAFAMGIATFRRWRPANLPGFVTASLHRSISLLAVVFVAIHVLTAILDPYSALGISSSVIPFLAGHKALWVGLGTLSLDLFIALIATSLLRSRIGARTWRTVHWAAYLSWPLAVTHSFGAGTDASTLWLRAIGIACIATVGGTILWRLAAPAGKHLEPQAV